MCQGEGVGWEGVGVRRDEEGSWCASVKVWDGREWRCGEGGERVCGGGKGGDGHTHILQLVVACNN